MSGFPGFRLEADSPNEFKVFAKFSDSRRALFSLAWGDERPETSSWFVRMEFSEDGKK